jgi:phage repressor protein C with HTH and peptisase S24 domain
MPVDPLNLMRQRIAEAIGNQSPETFVRRSRASFSKNTLRNWIAGNSTPGIDDLVELARLTGKAIPFFLPLNEGEQYVHVQKLDVLPAAGAGAMNDAAPVVEALEFPLWMAQKLTKTARGKVASLRFMRALGDSMEPLIEPGALLLVDGSDTDHRRPPKPKKPSDHTNIYVFLQDQALRVKRLRVDSKGATIALSENPAYDPEFLHKQDFKVLGRVIWWDNRL